MSICLHSCGNWKRIWSRNRMPLLEGTQFDGGNSLVVMDLQTREFFR